MIFHDSSATLISRPRPGCSAVRASWALIQAVAQAIRMPDGGRVAHGVQVEHEQPRVEVEARTGRAVEDPLQRTFAEILKRERRAAAVGRERAGRRLQAGGQLRGRVEHDLGDLRQRRLGLALPDRAQRLAQRRSLHLVERFADRGGGDRPQQLDLGVLLGAGGERVQPAPRRPARARPA